MTGNCAKVTSSVLATVETPFAAQRIVYLLREQGIACLLRDQETIYSIGRNGKRAGILVLVSPRDYSRAVRTLEDDRTLEPEAGSSATGLPAWTYPALEA